MLTPHDPTDPRAHFYTDTAGATATREAVKAALLARAERIARGRANAMALAKPITLAAPPPSNLPKRLNRHVLFMNVDLLEGDL